ncbi:MAG: hypothetical protein PHR77_17600 [Kiritimatiellae bacterium]|nr:hypothetical protein [Kiritimatiellia bacterium]MDD5520448.1 hypothetical protein [Kiritimatiellia bacterium]
MITVTIRERTTRAAADFREATQLLHGILSDESTFGLGKNLLLKCKHKERDFSFSIKSSHSVNGSSADFGVTVSLTNCQMQFLVAPKTFVFMLDKLSKTCLFSRAIEVDLRSRTAYVVGEDQDNFVRLVRSDRRLAEAVRYLVFESGLEGFGVGKGTLRSTKSFKAVLARPDRLRMLLQELTIIADVLDSRNIN